MDSNELSKRRLALVSKMRGNSVAILSSANKNFRTNDVKTLLGRIVTFYISMV